ncbi:Delta protein [Fasciola gigantica]|uniref:Delta protein n=1 Tax=Fasciola gigantica TaxID=46835 RepID=A0A504YSN1_FASGI|nr:Delta protein [Fasciola gigantica]
MITVICRSGGRCVSLVDGYRCICPPKFTGARCEQLRLACQNYSCANGGECLDHGISFTCHCPLGWTGNTCHENVNECVEIPKLTGKALCKHGAGCRDLLGSYECLCTTGWTGRHCEITERKNTGAETVCSNSSRCSEQPKTPEEQPVTQKLTENQTTDPGDTQSVRHFVALFTVMGVTIPLTLITLIAGIILFITNCRSYRKDHTACWSGYERPTRNLSKVNDYTTKRFLTTTDCQSTLFSASAPNNPRLYSNLLSTKKSSTAWSTTQIEREQLMTPTFRDDRIELEGIGGDQIAPNLEQKSKNDTPVLVRSNNNYLDTEFSHCPYSCVQSARPLHKTVVSQLPYIEQTVINTLALLSPSRACSPPPPYEEQNDCCFEHVIVNHSKS